MWQTEGMAVCQQLADMHIHVQEAEQAGCLGSQQLNQQQRLDHATLCDEMRDK